MSSQTYHYLLHPEITTDILQTIPDEDLPSLRDVFRTRWPYAIQAWRVIHQLTEWKRLNPKIGVRFTCPEGKWQDGTFVVIITEFHYKVHFFTLESSCERLCKALMETKLIEWRKGPYLGAVHEDYDEKIMETLRKVNGEIEFETESALWWLDKNISRNFDIQIPADVSIELLSPENAISFNEFWPHKFPRSELYLANVISKNGGYGVYIKATHPVLASWVTTNDYGAVAILQTLPEHTRKGYASLLLKILTQKAAEDDLDSMTYIVRTNTISQKLFGSIGFVFNNNVRWIQFKELENRIEKFKS